MANDLSKFLAKVETLAKSKYAGSGQLSELRTPSTQQEILDAIAALIKQNRSSNTYTYISGSTIMGDTFKDISGGTIINRSIVTSSLNTVRQEKSEDLAVALEDLGKLIAGEGKPELTDLYEAFVEEASKPEPKVGMLRIVWNGIKQALPAIAAGSTIAVAIQKFLG
ncbi:hypothetical protein [Roseateles sp.]|uniref:hypothetical protein n=1 Tax=Roseateles sp. TaxID=1971397 RepID=UPI003D119D50